MTAFIEIKFSTQKGKTENPNTFDNDLFQNLLSPRNTKA